MPAKRSIIVVDDELKTLTEYLNQLEQKGFNVIGRNGIADIKPEDFKRDDVDCIVLDMLMPVTEKQRQQGYEAFTAGLKLYEQFKAAYPMAAVVVFTNLSVDRLAGAFKGKGRCRLVNKPGVRDIDYLANHCIETISLPVWLDEAFLKLGELADLPDNWDGEGAHRPQVHLIASARSLLRVVAKRKLQGPEISATKMGNILFTWPGPERTLNFELNTATGVECWFGEWDESKRTVQRTEPQGETELLGMIERL